MKCPRPDRHLRLRQSVAPDRGVEGQAFTYTYDARNRPLHIAEIGQLEMIGHGYDSAGRLNWLSRRNGRQTYFEYDPVSRPTALTNTNFGSPADVRFDYGYNPASQIVTQERSNDSYAFTPITSASKAYAVNGLNQYTTVTGIGYTYDANGNLTQDGTRSYVYDAENRLVSVQNGPAFVYDPSGRLVEVSQPPYLTRFLYDVDDLVAEYDGSGTLVRRYVHGDGADQPLVQYDGAGIANRRFLETDHQGSIIRIGDNGLNTIATNRYDEYGVPATTNAGRFGYTGQQFMGELSMTGQPHAFYYYKARIYRADIGRFLQVDPIGYDDQINLYAYVGSDPVNLKDDGGKRIVPVGTPGEKNQLQRLIYKVAQSSPVLRARFILLHRSGHEHLVRAARDGEASRSGAFIPWNASNGTGSSTTNVINLRGETGGEGQEFSPGAIMAHELFGHAYDSDRGRLNESVNPKTGVEFSEESAVAAENEYRASAGEKRRTHYGDRRVGPNPFTNDKAKPTNVVSDCPRSTASPDNCGSRPQ